MIQLILWSCYLDPVADKDGNGMTKEKSKEIQNIVVSLLESGKFDVNAIDINDDTTMNIAAMDANMSWLLNYLVRRPDADPNIKNDINFTPFTTALHNKNVEGAKIIGMRTDLKVTDLDYEVGKENGIDVNSLINPTRFEDMGSVEVNSEVTDKTYHEVLSKIFSNKA